MLNFLMVKDIVIITFSLNLILSTTPDYILAQNAPDCSQVPPSDLSNECNRQANIKRFFNKNFQQSKKQMEISRQVKNFINPKEPIVTTEEQPEEESDKPEPEAIQKTKSTRQVIRERREQEEKDLFQRLVQASKKRNVSNKGRKARRTFGRVIVPYERP